MAKKFLVWTMPGSNVVRLMIREPSAVKEDWSVVDVTSDQNKLRHMLSVLQRTVFGGFSALPDLWNVMITFDGKDYRLWTYTCNWKGQSSFLAGILVGKSRLWKQRARQRRIKRV